MFLLPRCCVVTLLFTVRGPLVKASWGRRCFGLRFLGNAVYQGSDSTVLRLDWCSWELMDYSHHGRPRAGWAITVKACPQTTVSHPKGSTTSLNGATSGDQVFKQTLLWQTFALKLWRERSSIILLRHWWSIVAVLRSQSIALFGIIFNMRILDLLFFYPFQAHKMVLSKFRMSLPTSINLY